MSSSPTPKQVVFLGTYSLHPRQKLLIRSLQDHPDWEVTEVRIDVWGPMADKTQATPLKLLGVLLKVLIAYPLLALRYLCLPKHDAVVMMHAGLLDVLLLGGWVKLRRTPLIWDIYISVFDTLVNDRKMLKADGLIGRMIYALERKAARTADRMFLDTQAHASFFERLYHLPEHSVQVVYLGIDPTFDTILKSLERPEDNEGPLQILFYGNFIPLHGVDVIVEAFAQLQDTSTPVELTLVGDGQTTPLVDQKIAELNVGGIHRITRLPYEELIAKIIASDISLGIFGSSSKVQHVIPNKVYQIAASGVPFVTTETPAMKEFLELAGKELPCKLVPAGDPAALADALLELKDQPHADGFIHGLPEVQKAFVNLLSGVVPSPETT